MKIKSAFVILVGILILFSLTPVYAADRQALIDFYNSTNGDNWTNNSGWKTPPLETDGFSALGSECSWNGINCDASDNVLAIRLNSNNLVGSIPASIANFTNLQELILYSNQLTGPIPPELGNLSNLQQLSMASNEFNGSIPAELGNLASLQLLGLNSNQLTGSIPPELGNLTNLLTLRLNTNPLTGTIPSELGNLANLGSLYLFVTQVSGAIPPELGNLANLQTLNIGRNQLTGSIPPELANLASLTVMQLEDNQLSGTIPPELGNLANLQTLQIYNNPLSGAIPPELGNLANLQYLSLFNNQLTGTIPPELGNLTSLTFITLYGNQLSGAIPPELGNLANLQYLNFSSNQLSGTIPPELGNLSSLTTMQLQNNPLSGAIPPELGNLTNLWSLQIYNAQLSGTIPPELGNLASLTSLNLQNNQLSGAIPPQLGNLASLTSMNLQLNQLSGAIPPQLGNLTNLQQLQLGFNQLSGAIPAELGSLAGLTVLYLNANQLSGLIPPELGNLANLINLFLWGNQLAGPIPTALTNLTTLADNSSDIRYNALYTSDDILRTFFNNKQQGGNWEGTQTVAPTNLAAGTPSATSVPLTWTAIPYTAFGGYEVYYSATSGGPYTLFEVTAAKTVINSTVTGLSPSTTYYFVLRTVTNSHFNNPNTVYSEYSSEISATTTFGNSPPEVPTALSPANEETISTGPITINASNFSDPDFGDTHASTYWQVKYAGNIYGRSDYPASFNALATATGLTTHTVDGLVEGMKYEWRTVYTDSFGNDTFSNDYTFKIGTSEAASVPLVYPGAVIADFKMMTLPYWFDNPEATSILGAPYNRTEFRIGYYDCEVGAGTYLEADHPEAIAGPGEGFWALARNGLNITASGIPVTTAMDLEVPLYYNTAYANGWNQIGPPNAKNYYWGDLEIIEYDPVTGSVVSGPTPISSLPDPNTFIDLKIWRWNRGVYESFLPADNFLLEMYEGYWVSAKRPNLFLVFRVSAQQAALDIDKNAMLALYLQKGKKWFKDWVFVSPQAHADAGDTPPMPMGGLAETNSGTGGCFIATAAYGSPLQKHVRILKAFRDSYLLTSSPGRQLVRTYYRYSPPVADFISRHASVKVIVRLSLLPVVGISWMALNFGAGATLALMLISSICLIGIIRFTRQQLKR